MLNQQHTVKIDGIGWYVFGTPRIVQPVCVKHGLRMYPQKEPNRSLLDLSHTLKCEDCPEQYKIPRAYKLEKLYVLDKIDATNFKKRKFINLDDEALIIAEDKVKTNDGKYFVKAILTESKVGKRLVVYAGEQGSKDKSQIFIEPDIKRLAFDQTNIHPTDVFAKLEAQFADGTKAKMEK